MKNKIIDLIKDDETAVSGFSVEIQSPDIVKIPGPGLNRATIRETEHLDLTIKVKVSRDMGERIIRIFNQ